MYFAKCVKGKRTKCQNKKKPAKEVGQCNTVDNYKFLLLTNGYPWHYLFKATSNPQRWNILSNSMIKKKKILNTLKLVNIEPKHSALQHLRTMLMLYDTHMCKKKKWKKGKIHKLNLIDMQMRKYWTCTALDWAVQCRWYQRLSDVSRFFTNNITENQDFWFCCYSK